MELSEKQQEWLKENLTPLRTGCIHDQIVYRQRSALRFGQSVVHEIPFVIALCTRCFAMTLHATEPLKKMGLEV